MREGRHECRLDGRALTLLLMRCDRPEPVVETLRDGGVVTATLHTAEPAKWRAAFDHGLPDVAAIDVVGQAPVDAPATLVALLADTPVRTVGPGCVELDTDSGRLRSSARHRAPSGDTDQAAWRECYEETGRRLLGRRGTRLVLTRTWMGAAGPEAFAALNQARREAFAVWTPGGAVGPGAWPVNTGLGDLDPAASMSGLAVDGIATTSLDIAGHLRPDRYVQRSPPLFSRAVALGDPAGLLLIAGTVSVHDGVPAHPDDPEAQLDTVLGLVDRLLAPANLAAHGVAPARLAVATVYVAPGVDRARIARLVGARLADLEGDVLWHVVEAPLALPELLVEIDGMAVPA